MKILKKLFSIFIVMTIKEKEVYKNLDLILDYLRVKSRSILDLKTYCVNELKLPSNDGIIINEYLYKLISDGLIRSIFNGQAEYNLTIKGIAFIGYIKQIKKEKNKTIRTILFGAIIGVFSATLSGTGVWVLTRANPETPQEIKLEFPKDYLIHGSVYVIDTLKKK